MYDSLIVDVTPNTDVTGWNWGPLLVAFGIFEGRSGSSHFVPVMATNTQAMAVVPAQVDRGMAVIAPQHAAQAPSLFEQQVGFPTQAAYAASMATLMQRIGHGASENRLHYMRDKLEEECSLFLRCAKVAPIFTFPAWVNPFEERGFGAGVMFCGKPWDSYERRTVDLAAATLLNEPWHRTSVAAQLVQLAQRANMAAKDAIPCYTPYRTRAAALAEWHRLVVQADRLAYQFLQDHLPGWVGEHAGFTPTAAPWMATPQGIGFHIGLGDLPIPGRDHLVGGCHIELAA